MWTETFPVTEAQLRSLYATLREEGVFDRQWPEGEPIAGGEVQWLEATAAGKRVTLPSQPREADRAALGRVYAAVEGVVPDGVLRGLVERQEQHQRGHEQAAETLSPEPVP